MVWSQLAELRIAPIATTDFLYLRFIIGDRSTDEKNFGSRGMRQGLESPKDNEDSSRLFLEFALRSEM